MGKQILLNCIFFVRHIRSYMSGSRKKGSGSDRIHQSEKELPQSLKEKLKKVCSVATMFIIFVMGLNLEIIESLKSREPVSLRKKDISILLHDGQLSLLKNTV